MFHITGCACKQQTTQLSNIRIQTDTQIDVIRQMRAENLHRDAKIYGMASCNLIATGDEITYSASPSKALEEAYVVPNLFLMQRLLPK